MPLHSQPLTNITQDAQESGTLQSRLHTKCRTSPDRPVLAHPFYPVSTQFTRQIVRTNSPFHLIHRAESSQGTQGHAALPSHAALSDPLGRRIRRTYGLSHDDSFPIVESFVLVFTLRQRCVRVDALST